VNLALISLVLNYTICTRTGVDVDTHGADAFHGEQDGGEEQRHVAYGGDPRTGPYVRQWYGRRQGILVGEQADAGHHPRHGTSQADQYERGSYG